MYEKINSKTIYWGFPVCLITSIDENKITNITPISSIYNVNDTLMIGINVNSKAYANINLNKNIILNIIPENMWSQVENIAKYSSNIDNKNRLYTNEKDKIGKFKLIQSHFDDIKYIDNSLIYIEAQYNEKIVANGIANINYIVKNIYVKKDLLDDDKYIIEDKLDVIIYQFRNYKKLSKKVLGKSFRYEKTN
ncbi:hypothetical protein SHELI_v1c09000 [Spiroplasma helicoides]|uniref:Flavin reductase like domain-containing protein n=1 Tax=Spiroplasma helicoides TaxID=216938 RepID=A0A1B3SLN6_9MOLU|nr:hypothetical protein [Spiroplasma helicoides]AOG60849.1 hypothetical protein SHELI_v1c09000 [Spiroplasma helicoides]